MNTLVLLLLITIISFISAIITDTIFQLNFFISVDALVMFILYILVYANRRLKREKIDLKDRLLFLGATIPVFGSFPLLMILSTFGNIRIETQTRTWTSPWINLQPEALGLFLLYIICSIIVLGFIYTNIGLKSRFSCDTEYHDQQKGTIFSYWQQRYGEDKWSRIQKNWSIESRFEKWSVNEFISSHISRSIFIRLFLLILAIYWINAIILFFIEWNVQISNQWYESLSFLNLFKPISGWSNVNPILYITRFFYLFFYLLFIGVLYVGLEYEFYSGDDFYNDLNQIVQQKSYKIELSFMMALFFLFYFIQIGVQELTYHWRNSFFRSDDTIAFLGGDWGYRVQEDFIYFLQAITEILSYFFLAITILMAVRRFCESLLKKEHISIYPYENDIFYFTILTSAVSFFRYRTRDTRVIIDLITYDLYLPLLTSFLLAFTLFTCFLYVRFFISIKNNKREKIASFKARKQAIIKIIGAYILFEIISISGIISLFKIDGREFTSVIPVIIIFLVLKFIERTTKKTPDLNKLDQISLEQYLTKLSRKAFFFSWINLLTFKIIKLETKTQI